MTEKKLRICLLILRLISNPDDDISLTAGHQCAKARIGSSSIDKIADFATMHDISMFQALEID